ncbi:Carbon storage regulator [Aquisphaera giovannonii]|uniref:Translational regulator CsrA n=1 Tax=Aquisphaera giovannonii TaxID=406548 RepID=A0A5B9VYE4_9BACT|nr:carbon storage regulator [Aquisphaera giovannonii]QEH32755.1 Carbon storage regulator [Aquisphaera giovannonii]
MLVLSRKPLQTIMIGNDIKITIVKVERNQVRIGIEAPRNVSILRSELAEDATQALHRLGLEVGSHEDVEVEVLA